MAPADPILDEEEVMRAAKPVVDDPAAALWRVELRRRLLDVDPAPIRLGRFAVSGVIGHGGMGVVYSAHDEVLDREIALKVLHDSASEASQSIVREARAMAALSHPNVASVFEVDREQGHPYIAMEYVDGPDLQTWLEARPPIEDVLARLIEAGHGLQAAHDAGLCHGDFKPHNVLIGPSGAKVVDFGLARSVSTQDTDQPVGGTALYLARECLEGAPASPASDQYAFAVTVYEALMGRPPFSAKSVMGLLDAMETPPDLEGVPGPSRVSKVLARSLRSDPGERFESMRALLDALAEPPRSSRRWGVAAVGVAVVSFGVVHFTTGRDVCAWGSKRVQSVWSPARAETVMHAWSIGDFSPQSSSAKFIAVVDDYTRAWVGAHREACESTRVEGSQTGAMLDARMRCLDRRLSELDALLEAAELTADAREVAEVVVAATELAPVSTCEASASLDTAHLRPEDPDVAEDVRQVRRVLDRAWAARGLGRYDQVKALLEEAVAGSEPLRFEPLEVEVAFLAASLESRLGELDEAERQLRDCHARAVAVGNDRLAARASLMLLKAVMFSNRPDRVREVAPFARADATRAQTSQASIDAIVGEALLSQGDVDGALSLLSRALEGEAPPRRRALMMMTYASALLEKGSTEQALEFYASALQLVRDSLGDEHPTVAFYEVRLGRGLRSTGRLDEASSVLEDAVARTRAWHGDQDRATASAVLELGALGWLEGAYAMLVR